MAESALTIEFHVQAGVFLQANQEISTADLNRTFDLYLPFLGPSGFSLYQLLINELNDRKNTLSGQDHNFILDSLNVNLINFVKLRRRLEAVGLLKTSYYQDALGEAYTYQLRPALAASDFFNEKLLAGLLFKFVGEERFVTLQKRYGRIGIAEVKGTNISANFLQVFSREEETVLPENLLEKNIFKPVGKQGGFDFDNLALLIRGMSKERLTQHREFILAQHALYGLNESQLARVINANISLDYHDLNEQGVMAFLLENFANHSVNATDVTAPIQAAQTNSKPVTSTLASLYQAAEQLSPVQFIAQIKSNNGGFVSRGEERILRDLINQKILSRAVINILIYQVLVGMDNASLNRNLVDTIANSWAKAKLETPQQAVDFIKQRQEKATQTKEKQSYRPAKKVEPTMVKNSANPRTTSQTTADVTAALADLKQLKTKN
ncbi:DnaD domain protein [Convivina praedatoris]|uniref:Replication initiation and membrane attachment protein n=1 Tax=Convivina praedatoris TaxID=2880963 RepID=A0ABM9D1W8_9LACO|nr:DnaD domain protein [Convivina sp. LMG 32447]CAH1850375.1 Replication initiation and membrane attachment protein [Convivina sp. LMG 32447]CAH1850822.1 Replication initiation and membrane attachment protein [Convivina sp. LMG 32447]CAH1850834.1 Replication initiation and membrane attachment protein [Convivina sp. LMG 32447]